MSARCSARLFRLLNHLWFLFVHTWELVSLAHKGGLRAVVLDFDLTSLLIATPQSFSSPQNRSLFKAGINFSHEDISFERDQSHVNQLVYHLTTKNAKLVAPYWM